MNQFIVQRVNAYRLGRTASTFVQSLDSSVAKLPLREAVRYAKKNLKWTAKEFKHYSDAHANALLDYNFKRGDTVAVWMPDSAEKHVVLTAAAKIGARVVDVDTSLNSVTEIRTWLKLADCKALYFDPVDETHNKLLLLRKAIPEFYEYDDRVGQIFHSKHFPNLKYFIHTGFDTELGCLTFKGFFLPDPPVDMVGQAQSALRDDMPLYTAIFKGPDGTIVQSNATHASVLNEKQWYFAKKIIDKEYFEAP